MSKQDQAVPITSLNLEQLSNLKEALQEEAQGLSTSLKKLRIAQNRFADALQTVETFKPEKEGCEVFAPLTSSVYVKANLVSVDKLVVDVGTGYYVEKSPEEAKKYVERKMELVQDNMKKVAEALQIKQKNLESVVGVMQTKIAQAKGE